MVNFLKLFTFLLTSFLSTLMYADTNCQSLADDIEAIHIDTLETMANKNGQTLSQILMSRKKTYEAYASSELLEEKSRHARNIKRIDEAIKDHMSTSAFKRKDRIIKYLSLKFSEQCQNERGVGKNNLVSFQKISCFAGGQRFGSFNELSSLHGDVTKAINKMLIKNLGKNELSELRVEKDCLKILKKNPRFVGCDSILKKENESPVVSSWSKEVENNSSGTKGERLDTRGNNSNLDNTNEQTKLTSTESKSKSKKKKKKIKNKRKTKIWPIIAAAVGGAITGGVVTSLIKGRKKSSGSVSNEVTDDDSQDQTNSFWPYQQLYPYQQNMSYSPWMSSYPWGMMGSPYHSFTSGNLGGGLGQINSPFSFQNSFGNSMFTQPNNLNFNNQGLSNPNGSGDNFSTFSYDFGNF